MNDQAKFAHAKAGLRFCPECGKELEQHPNNTAIMACFVHGDMMLLWVEGDLQLRWRPLRMARIYIKEAMNKVDQDLKAELRRVRKLYAKQSITFLEAAQMIANIETGVFPAEPTLEQRRRARVILDLEEKDYPPREQ